MMNKLLKDGFKRLIIGIKTKRDAINAPLDLALIAVFGWVDFHDITMYLGRFDIQTLKTSQQQN